MRKVRASMGTLGVLGLELVQMDTPPTTAYLQIYTEERCKANCLFCAQAKDSRAGLTHIARGMYIPADLDAVVSRLKMAYEKGYLRRACIQTALYDKWWEDTVYLIKSIREKSDIPVSLSVFPLSDERYEELCRLGVNEIVIPLDACTPASIFSIRRYVFLKPISQVQYLLFLAAVPVNRNSLAFQLIGEHISVLNFLDIHIIREVDGL
jgi:biotin synthase-related radical SAM superfamily protein